MFYAQSWALANILANTRPPSAVANFFLAHERGSDVRSAAQTAFGSSIDEMQTELKRFINNGGRAFEREYDLSALSVDTTINITPANPRTIAYQLGRLSFLLGKEKYDQAAEYFNYPLTEDSQDASALSALAVLHANEGRHQIAQELTARAMDSAPEDPLIKTEACQVHYARFNSEEPRDEQLLMKCRTLLRESLSIEQDSAETHALLGWVYWSSNEPKLGLYHANQAHRTRPWDISLNALLGQLYI